MLPSLDLNKKKVDFCPKNQMLNICPFQSDGVCDHGSKEKDTYFTIIIGVYKDLLYLDFSKWFIINEQKQMKKKGQQEIDVAQQKLNSGWTVYLD